MGDPPPPPQINIGTDKLSMEGNIAVNFKHFKRAWEAYEIRSRVKEQTNAVRSGCLKSYLTVDCQEILKGLPFTAPNNDKENVEHILNELEILCVGAVNETYECFVFFSRNQKKW